MSIEKHKADLLDWYMGQEGQFCRRWQLQEKYNAIVEQKTLSADPYADEVLSGRLLNLVHDYLTLKVAHWQIKDFRLSGLPDLKCLTRLRGFGKKTRQEYIDVMTKYGFTDKIK